jgi:hypothetical protein
LLQPPLRDFRRSACSLARPAPRLQPQPLTATASLLRPPLPSLLLPLLGGLVAVL